MRPGHLGIIYNRFPIGSSQGIQEIGVCREGMNFVIPWFQRAIIYDVRSLDDGIVYASFHGSNDSVAQDMMREFMGSTGARPDFSLPLTVSGFQEGYERQIIRSEKL